MSLKTHFELMADYNQWMNESVYLAAGKLSADDLSQDRGAFFQSIIGTLNHILVGDIIWLKRFAEHPSSLKSLEHVRVLQKPLGLDTVLYFDFKELQIARVKLDKVIKDFASELTDEEIGSNLTYTNTKGELYSKNFGHVIQHFFNHQTHHRGQVTTLLNQQGIDVGVTDLLVGIPNT